MIKQAFVLGAGLGKRLLPLTEELPKPLVPIFQKPLITFAFDHLIAAGCARFIVNTHLHPACFAEVFKTSRYRERPIEFKYEPALLETGGGIKNAESSLGTEPFVVYSGDILTDIDLPPLFEEHFRAGNDVTLALRQTSLASGIALENGRVIDINNRYGHVGKYDFANVSIWNPEIFQQIPPGRKISFVPILGEWIGQGGKIGGVVHNEGIWFNIGSPAEYLEVHRTIAAQNWKPDYVTMRDWPVLIAGDAMVDASARFSGFCSVGAGCRIGFDAVLENTIVWAGGEVASRGHLRNCVVRTRKKAAGNLLDAVV
ncbi:MAG: sugar phosphate nucleotidyltransferase [Verrucomicrobiota bacterium]